MVRSHPIHQYLYSQEQIHCSIAWLMPTANICTAFLSCVAATERSFPKSGSSVLGYQAYCSMITKTGVQCNTSFPAHPQMSTSPTTTVHSHTPLNKATCYNMATIQMANPQMSCYASLTAFSIQAERQQTADDHYFARR